MNQSIPSVIVIISALLSIWLAVISVYFFRLHQQLQLITKGVSKKDLKTILTQLANDQENVSQELKDLRSSLTGLTADGHKHLDLLDSIPLPTPAEIKAFRFACLMPAMMVSS